MHQHANRNTHRRHGRLASRLGRAEQRKRDHRHQEPPLSRGDEWGIEADGNKVGTVTGQALHAIGDVYSLVTTSGNLVASESENFQPITHAATLYDWNNQETGRLEERFVALMPTVDIHHPDAYGSDNITGTATTVFASLTHQTTLTLP